MLVALILLCAWLCCCDELVVGCLELEDVLCKCCDELKWETGFFQHYSGLEVAITLWVVRLKLWGLVLWKAYVVPYKVDVLSFCS